MSTHKLPMFECGLSMDFNSFSLIYDAVGKVVSTLVNQKQNAGTYKVEFDGASFSSGVYFYRLEAGYYSDARRMVLIK